MEESKEELEAADEAEETEKERDFSAKNPGVCNGLVETHGGGVSFPPIAMENCVSHKTLE